MDQDQDDSLWQEVQRTGLLSGHPLHHFEAVDSTNTVALTMGRNGALPGTVVVADSQSSGRGRLGKAWSSQPGRGLYCTILLQPCLPVAQLARVTLAAGLATARAIDEICDATSAIKWPNDILLRGRKVAGILTECDIGGPAGPLVALGIGINLATRQTEFPPEVQSTATSLLLASGRLVTKGRMLTVLLRWVDQMEERLEQDDFAAILDEWRAKDATLGQRLSWLAITGQTVHGVSLGPDQEGQLVVRDSAGECHHVLSGDITLDPNTLNGYFP